MGESRSRFRLADRVALVIGGGQTPGLTIGNGKAAAILYAREGAKVFIVDVNEAAATETAEAIASAGGAAEVFVADVTEEISIQKLVAKCLLTWGKIDILHNNVGVGLALGDAPVTEVDGDVFDRVLNINLKSVVLTCKHVIPIMRTQGSGVITNISSFAAYANYPYISYKTSKAGVIALTQNVAIVNAEFGIRANVIVPGMINTPMAINNRVGVTADSRDEVIAKRDAQVPLGKKMGTAWDVAHAAIFLATDDASFISGVSLPVDGAQSLKIG
jgi:NAD(P)-dependent dehydrogenase (short-subunit alcohol dehydrogenase family)